MSFSYKCQDQWVAVYYYFNFYFDQVIDITSPSSTVVRWDFDIIQLSRDDRLWSVPRILAIAEAYKQIQTANHH